MQMGLIRKEMLMTRAANMSGVPSCTTSAVLSQLSSPFYPDLKSYTEGTGGTGMPPAVGATSHSPIGVTGGNR